MDVALFVSSRKGSLVPELFVPLFVVMASELDPKLVMTETKRAATVVPIVPLRLDSLVLPLENLVSLFAATDSSAVPRSAMTETPREETDAILLVTPSPALLALPKGNPVSPSLSPVATASSNLARLATTKTQTTMTVALDLA